MENFEKQDDNWTSLGYSNHLPSNNYYYPIAENKKPQWLIRAEEDRQLFQDWLQKKQRPTGAGGLGLANT